MDAVGLVTVHARRTLIAALLVTAAALPEASAQSSQDSGLHVKMASSPAPGAVQVLVDADDPHDGAIGANPAAADFTLWLADGAAPGVTVARNGARGKPLTSVFLFDASGSYRDGHGKAVSLPALYEYLKGAAGDELALVVFGLDTAKLPVRTSPAQLVDDLKTIGTGKALSKTNLVAALVDGIDRAAAEGEPGLRELLVFTDGGDEADNSDASWRDTIDRAVDRGVRVSVVVPPGEATPKGTKDDKFQLAIRSLKLLAAETSGLYLASADAADIGRKLIAARAEARSWLVLEGKLCGMKTGAGVEVRVEYVPGAQRKAWSAATSLPATAYAPGSDAPCPSQCGAGCEAWQECIGGTCAGRTCASDVPCPAGAACVSGRCDKPCAQACAGWQECKGGACAARACQADETCGAGARCQDGSCISTASQASSMLIWILAGAGALLLIAALLVLLRKKPPPEGAAVDAPAPAEPEPVREPIASPLDLDPLPETHLVAIGGWATPGERWRLHKRKTVAGASSDPADGVDLVFASVKQMSSTHAAFDLYPSGDLWVTDLGSTNGTFVNGRRLTAKERTKLAVGDQIKLSQNLILVVERPGVKPDERAAPAPAAPAPAPAPAPAAPAVKTKPKTKFDPGNG